MSFKKCILLIILFLGSASLKSAENADESAYGAIIFDNPQLLQQALKLGANAESSTENYGSLLGRVAIASKRNSLALAKILIRNNANVNNNSGFGQCTPLMFAVLKGNLPLVDLLLRHGADVTLKDSEGITALDYAKLQNRSNSRTIETLIETWPKILAERQERAKAEITKYLYSGPGGGPADIVCGYLGADIK